MKKPHLLAFLLLAVPLLARADDNNLLQNGDFSSGLDHWHGPGRLPSDMTPSDPFAKPDPFYSQGMIIALRPETWVKVDQDFRSKSFYFDVTVTYKVTPDFSLSAKPDDFTNVAGKINYPAYAFFNFTPGRWLVLLNDLNCMMCDYFPVKPQGGTDPQTFKQSVTWTVPTNTSEDKNLALAFPPGTGNIVILDVSVTDATSSVP